MNIKNEYDIVIIDSGVDITHPILCKYSDIDCIEFDPNTNNFVDSKGDICGHGTAIADLIKRKEPTSSILSIKIFEFVNERPASSEEVLLKTLSYIYDNLSIKVINMSLDVAEPRRIKELMEITKKLAEKNVIMIAAFENSGGITYPAALDWVIGVTMNSFRPLPLNFGYYNDHIINIVSSPKLLRVAWLNGEFNYVRGSSYSCAILSSEAFSLIRQGHIGFKSVLAAFKEKYLSEYIENNKFDKTIINNEKPAFSIKKAAVFPFNKEMHSVVRYADELCFDIVDVYDIKQSFRVGLTTNEVLKHKYERDYLIKNIESIEWNTFDTLILGCFSSLVKLFGQIDWLKSLTEEAMKKGKNIFSFERIPWIDIGKTEKIYYPTISKQNIVPFREKRLFRTAIPIIGVFGTASQQGKFTIQMLLRKEFKKLDCTIGQIGTEPHSLLFGYDFVFANGYHSIVEIDDYQQTMYLNDLLRRTCEKNPDIIITGAQAGVVPPIFCNFSLYSSQNYILINALKPDYAVVTVSFTDSVEYIKRTVDFLAALSKTKTLALVLFPLTYNYEKNESNESTRMVSLLEYEVFRDRINKELDIPVLFLDDEKLGDRIMTIILAEIS